MEAAVDFAHKMVSSSSHWESAYRPLPFLFLGLFIVWFGLVCVWIVNTWTKRHWQISNLQWMLTIVPVMKSLVLGLSFLFWYSCLNLSICSFWVAFGVFVTRIFLETACFVAFLLISHGYCIMHEQLSTSEWRTVAGLASLLYLTLTGYKAAVPQFAVFVMLIYLVMLYVIFLHLSRNLAVLQEQLQHIEDEDVQIMHTAVYTKYTMFKKFQVAMLMMVVAEILMHAKTDGVASEYWIRLLVREWTEIGIFFYIGWTFRSREVSPLFTVVPSHNSTGQRTLPPIFSIVCNLSYHSLLTLKYSVTVTEETHQYFTRLFEFVKGYICNGTDKTKMNHPPISLSFTSTILSRIVFGCFPLQSEAKVITIESGILIFPDREHNPGVSGLHCVLSSESLIPII